MTHFVRHPDAADTTDAPDLLDPRQFTCRKFPKRVCERRKVIAYEWEMVKSPICSD